VVARNSTEFRYDADMSHADTANVFTPTTGQELARFVAENSGGERRPLFPVGGRTALHYGYPRVEGDVTLDLNGLNRIVDYPARDMTITVEAGVRIEDLQKRLAAEGQRLPIDVAQAHRATVGGAVACNTSGPGRFGHGTFRDFVIGVSAVDGQGRLFSAGGQVVKNVAGYDLCKLLVGSVGTLAVITQLTLKVRPVAQTRQCLWATFAETTAVDVALGELLTSSTRPVAVEVLNPRAARQVQRESRIDLPIDRNVLCLTYEGGTSETDWQITRAQEELSSRSAESLVTIPAENSGPLWSALTEYQAASDDPLSFQASVPPSRAIELVSMCTQSEVAVQCHAGSGVLVGHLPDRCSTVQEASAVLSPMLDFANQAGGSIVVLDCDEDWKSDLSLFGPAGPAAGLSDRVKSALDPFNLLSPGRLG
jgi:glycolate oxidase FAD binding subunit